MRGAERSIDEHLDGDAGGGIEAFHLRSAAGAGQLRFIEVADRVGRAGGAGTAASLVKKVSLPYSTGRGCGACISSHRAVPVPAFFQECGIPVGINPKLPGPSVCVLSPICTATLPSRI